MKQLEAFSYGKFDNVFIRNVPLVINFYASKLSAVHLCLCNQISSVGILFSSIKWQKATLIIRILIRRLNSYSTSNYFPYAKPWEITSTTISN